MKFEFFYDRAILNSIRFSIYFIYETRSNLSFHENSVKIQNELLTGFSIQKSEYRNRLITIKYVWFHEKFEFKLLAIFCYMEIFQKSHRMRNRNFVPSTFPRPYERAHARVLKFFWRVTLFTTMIDWTVVFTSCQFK